MMPKYFMLVLIVSAISCNTNLQCERHYIPYNYIGKVVIYFDQKDGDKVFDKDGCIVHNVSNNGKSFTALPYKEGTAIPNETFRYFERISKDSIRELPKFYENTFFSDSVANKKRKYIFFSASGY